MSLTEDRNPHLWYQQGLSYHLPKDLISSGDSVEREGNAEH